MRTEVYQKADSEKESCIRTGNRHWRKNTCYILIASIVVAALALGIRYAQERRLQHEIAEKVLRFHVLANSDTAQDQELKLRVRDAVGAELAVALQGADTRAECEEIVMSRLDEIRETAASVLRREGCSDDVQVFLSEVSFPVKTYGSYTFPAGCYKALEIVIGEGAGHNWWCVMYPNLCFAGSVYEIVDEEAEETLRGVLSEEEYREVFSGGDYEVRFRYLPFLNELIE